MNEYFKKASAWFNNLIIRERWLVIVSAGFAVVLIMDLLLITPASNLIKQRQQTLASTQDLRDANQTQLDLLQKLESNSLLTEKSAQKKALQEQITALKKNFKSLSERIITADSLPTILEEMLLKADNLQLQEMTVEPPVLEIGDFYKHRVSVKFSGGFSDVVNYLKALENLEWNFYWDELNYDVAEYPEAEIELKVFTLSTNETAS